MQTNLSGQTLGKYELRALLGSGGMGSVYRAYDHSLQREVAVKVVNLDSNNAELQGRFIREARTAANLEHSHIVRVYDYGVERDINYIVMQNLTGGALSDRMKQAAENGRPRASLPEVAKLIEQLASALDYAHAQGVIHRDIKPQNVMFNNQGQAFIVDFGIAKLMTGATNMTVTGMAMGTPSYMSPEQWRTDDIVPASDQYALAVMTYQLIAGRLPFEADTPMRVMYRHLNDRPTPLSTFRPDIPDDLLQVMDRALAKDPDQRFPNCTQFAQAFSSAVSAVSAGKTEFFTFKLARIRPSGVPYTPTPRQPSSAPATPATNLSLRVIPLTQQPKSGPSRNLLIGGLGALVIIGILAVLLLGNRGPSDSDLRLTDVGQTLVAAGIEETDRTETRKAGLEVFVTNTFEPTAINTHTSQPTVTETPTDAPTATDTASPTLTPTLTSTEQPTATETSTASPTATLTSISTETATEAATLDVRQAAVATRDGFLTATATQWTLTPTPTETWTPDIPATIAAEITSLYHDDLTATATLWTPTFTPTSTYTATLTPTHTSTATSTLTPTLTATSTFTPSLTPTLNYTATIDAFARAGVSRNSDWISVERNFNGVPMVLVPVGCFKMGSSSDDDEMPVHEICFHAPFWIDKNEVTQGQFRELGDSKAKANGFSGGNRPLENITWFEADEYCQQRGMRLPTEAEWEYAARGPSNLTYPWGNTFLGQNAVYSGNSSRQTADVGSRLDGTSWVGAEDMSGNVWEWTSSLYMPYPYDATDGRESDNGTDIGVLRVLRGGSWLNRYGVILEASNRIRVDSRGSSNSYGLRCARGFDHPETITAVTSTIETIATVVPASITPEILTSQATAVAEGEQPTITVNVESANLRSGPGTNYAVVGAAKRGDKFDVVAQAPGWYLIKSSVVLFAWVSSSVTELDNPEDIEIAAAATIPPTPSLAPQTANTSGGDILAQRNGLDLNTTQYFDITTKGTKYHVEISFANVASGFSLNCYVSFGLIYGNTPGWGTTAVVHRYVTDDRVFVYSYSNSHTVTSPGQYRLQFRLASGSGNNTASQTHPECYKATYNIVLRHVEN